jgi:hypothetical protein
MRVKDRYRQEQIRHRDLSCEAARTQSSSTSLEISDYVEMQCLSLFFLSLYKHFDVKSDYATV